MPLDQRAIINQIDVILDLYKRLKVRTKYDDFSDLPDDEISEAVNLLFASIERLAPPDSSYVKNARAYEHALMKNIGRALGPLVGILKALRTDYDAGNIQSVVELIHADIFADFLEMGGHLLEQGYKDAAGVVIGSVLEEHLRKLCMKNSVAVVRHDGAPKKADALNSELAGATVYSKLDQKSVTAWLDLRNKAAHGNYADYTKEQVGLTLQGVRDFISRHPA